jgi:hypothetical protein
MDGDTENSPAEQSPATEPEEAEEHEGFANRAARRAKGKSSGRAQAQTPAKGQPFGGRGAVQGPRQWGNRRSG